MARGKAATVGDTMVNVNGYHNTRTADGWRLTHHLIAEEKLGRPVNTDVEMIRFVDGDRSNLSPDNIEVIKKNKVGLRRRKALIEAKIEDLQAELADIEKALASEKEETDD